MIENEEFVGRGITFRARPESVVPILSPYFSSEPRPSQGEAFHPFIDKMRGYYYEHYRDKQEMMNYLGGYPTLLDVEYTGYDEDVITLFRSGQLHMLEYFPDASVAYMIKKDDLINLRFDKFYY